MECVQERSRPKRADRHTEREEAENSTQNISSEQEDTESGERSERNGEDNVHSDADSGTNNIDLVRNKELSDSEKGTLNSLNALLSEQKEVFRTEEACIDSKKQATKERISQIFSRFRELLVQKENDLLDKVDLEYSIAGKFLADFVSNIEDEEENVSELLDSDRLPGDNSKDLVVDQIKEDIDTSILFRNEILNQFRVPSFVLNEDSLETVKGLNFGEFQEFSASDTVQTGEESAVCDHRETVTDENVSETVRNVTDDDTGINENNESNDTDVGENAEGGEQDNQERCREKESEACGATETSSEASTPSAPPIMPEEAPPSYWQAIGLHGPREETQPRSEIPGYYDIAHSPSNRLPENKLEPWHSFPIRRQYDRRGPMPVALTWNHGKICIADRANMRVKFFTPNGQLITEMYFSGTEIHDVTFLEESQGESRYVLTSPKSKTLMIIGIDSLNTPKVIRKLAFAKQYSCVCRGPRMQTLIGAEITSKSGTPVVNMFTFTGQVLLSITHTPSYVFLQYIKSVEVFGNYIIVLDWKINSVSVYQDDGTAVGEYRGTANSPLINPLDMTLDNQGNIMILNGEFSNIHVVDLHCNPIEIFKLPSNVSSGSSSTKLLAFDLESRRLATARSNGDVGVFTFQNGYDCLPQRNMAPNLASAHDSSRDRRVPEVLPLVEGMLPSTIEDIITRQPARNRSRQFHL